MTWSTLKTHGIVLRVDPAREADRRYRLLTADQGKIEFIGRGAQKGSAKLAAHLEPFAVVDIEIVQGRRSTTVISVERVRSFPHLARSLEARLLAQAGLQLLDRYTREHDDDARLYAELLAWLSFLDRPEPVAPARRMLLLSGFVLRSLSHMGYDLVLDTCIACKEDILPLAFRWHGGKGGLVCSDCVARDREEWYTARTIAEEVVTLLRFMRSQPYEAYLQLALLGAQVEALAGVVHDLVVHHLPGDFDVPFWTAALAHDVLEVKRSAV